ncbi:MAG: hypothetical protein MUF77_08040 [Leptospira sp.]|jgi:hypothetical protein|nr:hypothetical protein [Leptospira sp.]
MLLNFVSRVSIPFLLLVSVLGGSVSAEPIRLPKEGFRSNILWPIFPGGKFRFVYRRSLHANEAWRTDLLLGLGHSVPENRPTEGTFTETSGILGFRQFLKSPWHFEFQAAYGRSRLTQAVSPGPTSLRSLALASNSIDLYVLGELIQKRSYTSMDLELMALIGYEWKLSENWSLDLQAGVAKVVSKSNPWPIYADANRREMVGETALPVGVVNATYWF